LGLRNYIGLISVLSRHESILALITFDCDTVTYYYNS